MDSTIFRKITGRFQYQDSELSTLATSCDNQDNLFRMLKAYLTTEGQIDVDHKALIALFALLAERYPNDSSRRKEVIGVWRAHFRGA